MDLGRGVDDYEELETEARETIMKHGGSISHHHGVGRKRRRFMMNQQPKFANQLLAHIKKFLDPNNIFAVNGTFYYNEEDEKLDLE